MTAKALGVMLAGAMMVAGCATSRQAEVRVTRFNIGQPIAPGDVVVEPLNPAAASSLEFGSYQTAVARELTGLGFRVAPGLSRSEIVAVVDVQRGTRQALAERSPVSIGIGGGGFSGGRRGGGVGLGGGVSFPIGKGRNRDLVATELAVQLKRRSDGSVIWEGRANTVARADAPDAAPQAAVDRLASALFQGFPGRSGETIRVK